MKRDANCTLCRLHQDAKTVCLLGRGPKQADIMVVGEAPGAEEDEQGLPFVGKSGKFLTAALEVAGFDPKDLYICNAVSCRPKDNRTPTKGEVKACRTWLQRQIDSVKPKYILLLGNTPLLSITGSAGIKKRRGVPFEKDGIIYLPTYHPAFIGYDVSQAPIFKQDLDLFKKITVSGGIPREVNVNSVLVTTTKQVDELLKALKGPVSFDIEGNFLYQWKTHDDKGEPDPARITMFGFGTARAQYSIPVGTGHWEDDEIKSIIARITERLDDCFVITHAGKFDMLSMWVLYGVQWRNDFCTMMASYITDENEGHGLKELAQKYLGAPNWDVDKATKQGNTSLRKQAMYHAHDLYYTRKLRFFLGERLNADPEVKKVFHRIIMPITRLFTEAQYDGVVIDMTKFGAAENKLRAEYNAALAELNKHAQINWRSTQQMAELFFGKKGTILKDEDGKTVGKSLGLAVVARTAKGAPSVNESVIKRLNHPCVDALLKFKETKQQLSFFIDGWKPHLVRHGDNYYLHPNFKLHGTVTGRPSAENPNLYQVPRDPVIRQLVSSEKGWTVVECDLSQIELRIAAELSRDPTMMQAFRDGIDIHWMTALREIERGGGLKDLVLDTARTAMQDKKLTYSQCIEVLLKIGPDQAVDIRVEWKEYRKKAKAVNFGYLYGMWWKKFKEYARDNYGVVVSDEQAEASRNYFFMTYAKLEKWHKRQKAFAREHGYVRSLSGRKRRLPDAQLKPWDEDERSELRWVLESKKKQAERQAINSPVQSFANELNFMAAIQLRKEYSRDKVRIFGTVYDAILMRVKNEYVEEVTARLLKIMSGPDMLKDFDIELTVPICAEAKVGPWGIGIAYEKWLKLPRKQRYV